jgi:hypothetical protein
MSQASNRPRPYLVFKYVFRTEGLLIWGIRDLAILFASKMTFVEVMPMMEAKIYLSF